MLALSKEDRSLGGKRASKDTMRNVHEDQLDKMVKAIAGLLDVSPKKRKEIKQTLESGSGAPLQVRYRPVNFFSYSSSYIHDEDMSRTILVNGVEELLKVGTGRCASWQEAVIQFLNPPGRPSVPVHGIVGEKDWMDDNEIFLVSRHRICCSEIFQREKFDTHGCIYIICDRPKTKYCMYKNYIWALVGIRADGRYELYRINIHRG